MRMELNLEIVETLRQQFPALKKQINGRPAVFFDGPAGTQVPQSVIDAISDYLINCNANSHGVFATSIESDQVIDAAHQAAADFVGSPDADTIAFGGNMTSLTFALSRALARSWKEGDEIVLSRLEHDANFSPWRLAAEDAGVTVRYVDIDPTDCTLNVDEYASVLNEKTRLVAVGCASNAAGTINPVKQICHWACEVGAISFLDAVHYAPHDLIDVVDWDCDFLICSAYKFFGPHVGIMYGRRELLEGMQPYKLRPSPNDLPGRWMTGTQNFECINGTRAAIDYLANIGRLDGDQRDRREALVEAFRMIRDYERKLVDRLLDELAAMPQFKVWGVTKAEDRDRRFPTVSITHESLSAETVAKRLANAGIFCWNGNYYALPLTERIGVEPDGMVRIGLAHYNTEAEVDRLLAELQKIGATV